MYVYLRILRSKNEMSSLVIFMIRLPLSDIKKYFNFTIGHVGIFHQSLSGNDQGYSRYGAIFGHFQHRILRCGLSKIIIASRLIFAVIYAVRFKFSQNHNRTASHFCGHICGAVYKCGLNDLKLIYFSNFGFFLPSPKLIFSFVLVQVLNY